MTKYIFQFNKLVRDKIEQKLRDNDIEIKLAVLDSPELIHYFKAKLVEEAKEVADASTPEEVLEELADCLEVIHGFMEQLQVSEESLEQKRRQKITNHGSFEKGTVIDKITIKAGHPALEYYLKNPEKYPEVRQD